MKRWLVWVLALLAAAGLLAGCGAELPGTEARGTALDAGGMAVAGQQDGSADETGSAGQDGAAGQDGTAAAKAEQADAPFSILFLDVGQADCMLLSCGGHYMLVDGGNPGDSRLVAAALKNRGVTYLDYIVCTHAHEDHAGGLSGALNVCEIGQALAPVQSSKNLPFSNFAKYVKKQGKSITVPEADETFALGDAAVQVLGPRRDYDSTNNTSLVLMVTYGETRFLLTGDMEREAEQDLIDDGCDLKADLLKVGHHGSYSSTSYVFLNEVMPEYAVIQVGKDNGYGHPRDEVLSRLRDAGVTLYRNDLQGDILALSDGETVTVIPAKNADAETNPTKWNDDGQNAVEAAYIGNSRSEIFHRPSCSNLPAEENRVYFQSRTEAVIQGYSPCGQCRP